MSKIHFNTHPLARDDFVERKKSASETKRCKKKEQNVLQMYYSPHPWMLATAKRCCRLPSSSVQLMWSFSGPSELSSSSICFWIHLALQLQVSGLSLRVLFCVVVVVPSDQTVKGSKEQKSMNESLKSARKSQMDSASGDDWGCWGNKRHSERNTGPKDADAWAR